jgi:hypothetical protein
VDRVVESRRAGGRDRGGELCDADRCDAVGEWVVDERVVDGCVVDERVVDGSDEVAERGPAVVPGTVDGMLRAEGDVGAAEAQSVRAVAPEQYPPWAVTEERSGSAAPVEMSGPRTAPSPASPPDTRTTTLLADTS